MSKPKAIRCSTSFSTLEVQELQHAMDTRRRSYQGELPKPFTSICEKLDAMQMKIRRETREARDAG